ncbi:MAG: cache domain-containing protein, partial [Deltaproteobacteria bacterium]|nr:cache domain-containing protein [Deltaproteobacteria bacterium]
MAITIVGVVVACVAVLCVSVFLLDEVFEEQHESALRNMQGIIKRMRDDEVAELIKKAALLGQTTELAEAVAAGDRTTAKKLLHAAEKQLHLDGVLVTDAGGRVFARSQTDRAGDDYSGHTYVARALNGETKYGILYDEKGLVPFSRRAGAPLYRNGAVIGTVVLVLNLGRASYVDSLKALTGMEVTIFRDDVRVMTSIRGADGKRITGTKLDNPRIEHTVLKHGETVVGKTDILGDPYYTAYWPLQDEDGTIMGMWFIGNSAEQQAKAQNKAIVLIGLCSLGIALYLVLFAAQMGRRIALPLTQATDFAVQVADGNLDASMVEVKRDDEVGLLVDALSRMVGTLKDRIAEAEAANHAKSAFLAVVSHEIRTPMNAILGLTEIQLQNDTLPQAAQDAFGRIYTAGYTLLGIINDILDLSRMEAGKVELAPGKYDTASLINDTVQLNLVRIGGKPIEFELRVAEDVPSALFGDELRIKQILNNLLSNAFKYTQSGEVVLSVSAEYGEGEENPDVTLVCRVSDTGHGMTEEQVNRLFEEYSRFNMASNRTIEGIGLGMSITRQLVHMMNGEILVESKPDSGSAFTVRLPQDSIGAGPLGREVVENLQQFMANMPLRKVAHIVREPMPYGSVLVVDDLETNLYVTKGLLAPYGLAADTALSGFEAIEKIRAGHEYDIVFMDHMMPKMDGLETTKILRALGYARPIIALTANAVAGQAEMFLENGFNGFMSKPVDLRQLNLLLNRLVRDKQPPEVIEAARRQKGGPSIANRDIQSATDQLAGVFARDAEKAVAALEAMHTNQYRRDDDIHMFVINV